MIVNVLTDKTSWINQFIPGFLETIREFGVCEHVTSQSELKKADITFILSFFELLTPHSLGLSQHNLVVHESDLPIGRGWSPLTWQVLEGKNRIPTVLFEAAEKADRGKIYLRQDILLRGDELVSELREAQAKTTFELCLRFLREYPGILEHATEQVGFASAYKRRTPKDSELDVNKSIAEQFQLLRVVDNDKYPAFFRYQGSCYRLKIEKVDSE